MFNIFSLQFRPQRFVRQTVLTVQKKYHNPKILVQGIEIAFHENLEKYTNWKWNVFTLPSYDGWVRGKIRNRLKLSLSSQHFKGGQWQWMCVTVQKRKSASSTSFEFSTHLICPAAPPVCLSLFLFVIYTSVNRLRCLQFCSSSLSCSSSPCCTPATSSHLFCFLLPSSFPVPTCLQSPLMSSPHTR